MKFAINFGANVTAFLLSVFLSVWMTPFIVKTLGVEAFGFVHLTQNIINYFSIITVALSSVVVRFFSVAAHRGEQGRGQCVCKQLFSRVSRDISITRCAARRDGFFY